MQVINKNDSEKNFGYIYLGIVLILSGLLWLGYNFAIVSYVVFDYIFSWQILMLIIGGYLLSCRRWTAGAIVSAIALCYIIIDLCHISISFTKVILPVMVILIGVGVLTRKIASRD